jgi:hypothetical protein
VKHTLLGVVGGLVLGLSCFPLYDTMATGILSCGPSDQTPMCRANYARNAITEATAVSGLLLIVGSLWWAQRATR